MNLIGWDLATKLNGYAAGDGSTPPTAGAFKLTQREVPAELGCEFKGHVLRIHAAHPADAWFVEEPLINPKNDVLWTVERLIGLWFLLHTLAGSLGIPCTSINQGDVKKEWGGFAKRLPGETSDQRRHRHKLLSAEMAERMGVILPQKEAQGRFDAADASGVWKCGLRLAKNPYWQRWDMRVHGHRGALL
jgi:hypothetical protein